MMAAVLVSGVVTQQQHDISDVLNAVGAQHGIPPRLLVALAIAESELNELAWRDTGGNDRSAGLFQQTIRWAPIGDQTHSAANIAYVRRVLTTDIPLATDIAARQLAAHWQRYGPDAVAVLARYNKPATGLPPTDPRYRRYVQSWAESAQYAHEAPPGQGQKENAMPPDAVLRDLWKAAAPGLVYDRALGICQWWSAGGYREVGSPVGPEHLADDGSPWQAFSRGLVHWTGAGAEVQ
jgi:hypothetical protein